MLSIKKRKQLYDNDFILKNYDIRPVKIDEVDIYVRALCQQFHPKFFQIQKEFINWGYKSPLRKKFVHDNELTIMAAFNKKTLEIDAAISFVGSISFFKNKELLTVWDIQYSNFSNTPGLALEVLKKLNLKTEVYCGNNLNRTCIRSYQRIFDMKNFLPEVNRKMAIVNSEVCNNYFNQEKNLKKSVFIKDNQSNVKKCKIYSITDLSIISEVYWWDHIERFSNTGDRSKNYLTWRFIRHPYMKYHILSLDSKADKGLAIVRIEKIKGLNCNALRVLDIMPRKGFEKDIQNVVLNFAKNNNCIFADFFCSFEKKIDEICSHPFIDFKKHKPFNIPYRLQPPEVKEKKSFNLFINFNNNLNLKANKFYTTKSDGEMDLYFDQSGKAKLLENYKRI